MSKLPFQIEQMLQSCLNCSEDSLDATASTISHWMDCFPHAKRNKMFFREIDPMVKNSDIYWKLLRTVLSRSHGTKKFFDDIDKSLKKFGRLNSTVEERVRKSGSNNLAHSFGIPFQDDAEMLLDSLPDVITAYRGFLVSGKNRVREGKSSEMDDWFQQKEGKGFSYTLDKDIAKFFAARSAHHYADKLPALKAPNRRDLTDKERCFKHFYRGGTPYIAEYSISKEDIILIITEVNEQELFVHPNNVDLQWYAPLTSNEILKHYVLHMLQKKMRGHFPINPNEKFDDPEKWETLWAQMVAPVPG